MTAAATSTADLAAAAVKELEDRGISNPDELLALSNPASVLRCCEQFDKRRGAGPGLLARMIRDGDKPSRFQPALNRSILAAQRDYADKITAWLQHHFPDLCREQTPHPAAINAVVRLHHTHGKGTVTAAEHGDFIRAFVEAWDHRYAYSDERNAA